MTPLVGIYSLTANRSESCPAIIAVARKAPNANQFCGSAIVSVPTGGRKKKLNAGVETTGRKAAYQNPK